MYEPPLVVGDVLGASTVALELSMFTSGSYVYRRLTGNVAVFGMDRDVCCKFPEVSMSSSGISSLRGLGRDNDLPPLSG